MESKSFVKLLRKVIREEVCAAVRTEIKSVLNENTTVTKHESDLQKIVGDTKKYKPKAKKKFTKNSMLNDILNETATSADFSTMRDGPAVMQQEYPSMGNYKAEMADSFGMQRGPAPLTTTGINGEPMNMNNEGVKAVASAMTKDYSALMKAIDKKKGK